MRFCQKKVSYAEHRQVRISLFSDSPCSGSSNRTPLFTSSSLGFRIEIFRSKTGIKLEKEKKTHLENRAGWKFKKNFFKGSDLQRK